MVITDMPENTLPCPFCGSDADVRWVVADFEARIVHSTATRTSGKCILIECSGNAIEGACVSPRWFEDVSDYESDADCVKSAVEFWNRRA
jgi:hypothetical protein